MYDVQAHTGYGFITGTIIVILLITIAFLIFFANDFANPINEISNYMERLANGESVDYNRKLPVK